MRALATRDRGEFSRGLNRAAASRGALDTVYRDLSDHWTVLMQELYPVWVLIGAGLSNPGHIEVPSRTVYLDSEELLGSREEILAGRLERFRVLVCFGVAFHEVMHAKHTKRWVIDYDARLKDEGKTVLLSDRRLLEEPRMEAHGVRDYPEATARGTFIRRALSAMVPRVLVSRFQEEVEAAARAGAPLTRDICGRAMTYLAARTHYDVVDPATLGSLTPLWESVLGTSDMQALHDLHARLIWVPDGDCKTMDAFAEEYREIIGAPDPPPPSPGGGSIPPDATGGIGGEGDACSEEASEGDGEGSGEAEGSSEAGGGDGEQMKSLGEALKDAQQQAQAGQLQQLNEDVVLKDLLDRAEGAPEPQTGGRGTGAPTGRMPNRGVNRPAHPDEIQAAARFANRLEQARTHAVAQLAKRTPGGRFDARSHMRALAQRQHGLPVTAHSWSIERIRRNPIQAPHVIFILDTSGSMAVYEYALGPVTWILDTAVRMVGGRMATGLFGNSASLLSDGSQPMRLVPAIRTGGGTAFAGDAIEMCAEHLEMENMNRPRLAYIFSDGGWFDTETGVAKIEWLMSVGVPVIHIALLHEPLSVQASRITVITDPADALEVVATDTVQMLQQGPRALLAAPLALAA
jgi:Mg-chelatase subunit ChlD